jgi:hypothetical protein
MRASSSSSRTRPLIGEPNFTINGVNVGVGQYLDEFQRANFWSKVGGTPYHTTFGTNPPVLGAVSVTVPIADGVTVRAAHGGKNGHISLGRNSPQFINHRAYKLHFVRVRDPEVQSLN